MPPEGFETWAKCPATGPLSGSERLRRPLLCSVAGHFLLASLGLLGTLTHRQVSVWGEALGGAATVRLVSAASIPLPAPTIATKNKVATEEPGLHFPEAKPAKEKRVPPKPTAPEKAIELPGRGKTADRKPSQTREEARLRKPPPDLRAGNEIPYGQGGPVQGPYGVFQTEAGAGGIGFAESAGDFAIRYSWYVAAIRNRISSNWLKGTVDPHIRVAPRVFVTFQILRDGQIANPQLMASSGIASLDRSALRALYDSNPMPPLPADYRGSSVAVEFWFDFRR